MQLQQQLVNDHYSMLDIPTDASSADVHRAFRMLIRKYHPDRKGGSDDVFKRLVMAHDTLSDELLRREYDKGRDLDLAQEVSSNPRTLQEEVKRRYFPTQQAFELFGDPLEKRRENEARKKHEAEMRDVAQRRAQDRIQLQEERNQEESEKQAHNKLIQSEL